MQWRERVYLSSFVFTFGMKRSSYFLLSKFFQRWALHLPQALCLMSLQSSVLLKFVRTLEMEWVGNEVKEVGGGAGVGRRGKFWGREGGWKIPRQGKRMCFWFIPKTAWTVWSWIGALVVAGSLQPSSSSPLRWNSYK
jgi:hypothetical protein